MPHASLTFLGAAGTVTGSRHLLRPGGRSVLVDCGLFQGLKAQRLKNGAAFPVEPPRRTFIVHGEPPASDALRQRIEAELGWDCEVPAEGDTRELL